MLASRTEKRTQESPLSLKTQKKWTTRVEAGPASLPPRRRGSFCQIFWDNLSVGGRDIAWTGFSPCGPCGILFPHLRQRTRVQTIPTRERSIPTNLLRPANHPPRSRTSEETAPASRVVAHRGHP